MVGPRGVVFFLEITLPQQKRKRNMRTTTRGRNLWRRRLVAGLTANEGPNWLATGDQEIHPGSDARRALRAAEAGVQCAASAPVQPGRAWRWITAVATPFGDVVKRRVFKRPNFSRMCSSSARSPARSHFLRSISSCWRWKSRAKIKNPIGVLARRRRESGSSLRHYGRRQFARNGHCQTA